MYKTRSYRDILREQGSTRTGSDRTAAQKKLQTIGIGNGRWNRGVLPKGATRGRHIIGSQETGRK